MTQNKKVIGITGGSGCGKSYISAAIAKMGYPVIDCDKVAREVTKKGSECLLELCNFFGDGILKNGELDRQKLAGIVFYDSEKLRKLNEITHKYILENIYDRIKEEEKDTVIVDGAVLIESGFCCDKMVGILADRAIRKSRIMLRDSLTPAQAEARISAQKSDDFYLKNCDVVLYNNDEDIAKIIKRLIE